MKAEFEISVAELKSALPGLSKIVGSRSTLPVLRGVKLTAETGDRPVLLEVTNLDETASVRLAGKAIGLGTVIVPLSELAKIAKGCASEGVIRVSEMSKDKVGLAYPVASTTVHTAVAGIDPAEWPVSKPIETSPTLLDDKAKAALREAMECCSADASRQVLNGACLDVRSKEAHYVVGTDGRHLFSANSFLFDLPESLIIPNRKFLGWPTFLNDGAWKICSSPASKNEIRRLQVASDHWTYRVNLVEGEFPKWKQAVPAEIETWTKISLGKAAVTRLLEAIPLLPGASEPNQTVTLSFAEQSSVKAKDRDQAEFTTVPILEAQIDGHPVAVTLDRRYLLRALRFGFTEARIADGLSPIVFVAEGRKLIVMPCRPESAGATPTPTPSTHPSAPAPSPAEAATPTENERTSVMPETTMPAPVRGNLTSQSHGHGAADSSGALDEMIAQIGVVKTDLKKVLDGLGEAEKLLRRAQKEHKATEKEIGRARSALRSLQSVEI